MQRNLRLAVRNLTPASAPVLLDVSLPESPSVYTCLSPVRGHAEGAGSPWLRDDAITRPLYAAGRSALRPQQAVLWGSPP